MSGIQTKKQRIVSIELLRILAMLMVVMLHYLSKGELLEAMTGPLSANGYIAWLIEAFAIVAVNVYMLISGFFLVESGFKAGRIAELVCQVLFYSLLVPPVLMALGILHAEDLTIYKLLQYIFPTQMEHYWFATAYVIMYLFCPLLSTAVRAMKREQLRTTILLLLLLFSVGKSVLPVRLTMDKLGYDGLWFMCVFLVAAYMRLYGFSFFRSAKQSFLCYAGACLSIYLWTLGLHLLYMKTEHFDDFLLSAYSYNHVLNLLAAISLFQVFYHWEISGESFGAKWIVRIAPYTFGVYLLHEHLELRTLWPKWLGASLEEGPALLVIRAVAAVFLVFVIGIAVDMLRGRLFALAKRVFRKADN